MKRKYIKKYGLRYLGILAKMTTNRKTYETTDTWYSRKMHGLVANFPETRGDFVIDWVVYKNPMRGNKCWLYCGDM